MRGRSKRSQVFHLSVPRMPAVDDRFGSLQLKDDSSLMTFPMPEREHIVDAPKSPTGNSPPGHDLTRPTHSMPLTGAALAHSPRRICISA